jgi:hypothetical protein
MSRVSPARVHTPAAIVDHPDRARWNAKYAQAGRPAFTVHPLVAAALAVGVPAGPVAEWACGSSGNALALAAAGCEVAAVDVADLALDFLEAEAERRGLTSRISCVHADLETWQAPLGAYALVLCVNYWSPTVFAAACTALAPAGLLAWQAWASDPEKAEAVKHPDWYLRPGEPASLLPAGFTVVISEDLPGHHGPARRLLARRAAAGDSP